MGFSFLARGGGEGGLKTGLKTIRASSEQMLKPATCSLWAVVVRTKLECRVRSKLENGLNLYLPYRQCFARLQPERALENCNRQPAQGLAQACPCRFKLQSAKSPGVWGTASPRRPAATLCLWSQCQTHRSAPLPDLLSILVLIAHRILVLNVTRHRYLKSLNPR